MSWFVIQSLSREYPSVQLITRVSVFHGTVDFKVQTVLLSFFDRVIWACMPIQSQLQSSNIRGLGLPVHTWL